ncbi:MAG: hypothetical protein ACKO34_08480 [Vampirovibrionales bacterium]
MGLALANITTGTDATLSLASQYQETSIEATVTSTETTAYEFHQQHLKMIQVTVSPVFTGRGKLYTNLSLPVNTKIVNVQRKGESIYNLAAAFVRAGDVVVCLSENEEQARRYFMFGLV